MLKDRMENEYINQCNTIISNYKHAEEVVKGNMLSPEDVQYIESFKSSLILDMVNWKENTYRANKILFKMMELDLVASELAMDITSTLFFWPEKLRQILDDMEESHRIQRNQQEHILKERREAFEIRAGDYADKIGVVETFREIRDCDKVMESMRSLNESITQLREERQIINKHEKLLFDYESPFEVFKKVEDNFTPYYDLWSTVDQF